MAILTASYEYSGMSDYWGGNGRRWDDDAGCVFAFYGARTTLRDIIDDAVSDFCMGGDCDTMPEEIDEGMVRAALLDCLSPAGRADYKSGALSEFAAEYADCNGYDVCLGCGEAVDDAHLQDCPVFVELMKDPEFAGEEELSVVKEDCKDEEDDDCCESPFVVFLLECEVCEECGKAAEHHVDDVCKECYDAEALDDSDEYTDVVFLRYPAGAAYDDDDIFAVFPGIAATVGNPNHATCYAHVGQHSAADIGYCAVCTEVTDPDDYRDLANELSRIGYVLNVVRLERIEDAGYADSRAAQLKR